MNDDSNPPFTRNFRETLWEQLSDPAFRLEFTREFIGYMKSGDTQMLTVMGCEIAAWVEHNPGDPPIETDTDWDRVNAMTDEEIRAAVAEDPDAAPIPVHETPGLIPVVNTRRLRNRLGLTQEEFSSRYRIPVGTLRDWEQGRKFPDAPARAYLTVIENDPNVVAVLLGETAA
jgi:putative transcriptional regulator